MENKRDVLVDVLRGIAVLAVLLGHAIQRVMFVNYEENIIFKIIYSFHMPLFMLLSGYSLYKYTKKYELEFFKKRFFRLIIPTIVWSYLIYFVRNFEFVGIKEFIPFPDSIIEYTRILLWHPDYIIWFLYIVFICNIIFGLQKKLINEKLSIIVTILITIGLYLLPKENFGIARLQIYFPIFSLGYYLAMYFEKIRKYLNYMLIPSVIAYIMLFPFYNVIIDNVIVFYSISISAMIILYYIVKVINNRKINEILCFFGKKSLEIYLCQCVCLNLGIGTGIIRVISIFITATVISLLLTYVTNKFKITKILLYGKIGGKNEQLLYHGRIKKDRNKKNRKECIYQ